GFVTKFTPDGTRSWTNLFGSSKDDQVRGISINSDGALFIAGDTSGNYEGLTNAGGTANTSDAFLTRINTTINGTLNVITADGAVLDSSKLAKVDGVTISTGNVRLDASLTDEAVLASKITVENGASLTIDNYVDADMGKMTNNGGSILVNTAAGAVLNDVKLNDVTTLNIASGSAESSATLLTSLGINRISFGDGATLNIVDSAAGIVASNIDVLNLAVTVTANTEATATQAASLANFSKPVVFNIRDTASALAAAPSIALNEAVNINATGTASAASTITLLAATNSGTTTLASASMTATEALALQFDSTGNDTIVSLTIPDGGTSNTATTASQAIALTNLKAGGDVTGLTIIGITDTAANIAPISAGVLSNITGVVTANSYQSEDLRNVVNQTLQVVTATGAQLDSTNLQTADGITIGAGSARIDAATSDEVSLVARTTVASGTSLFVDNYLDTNLTSLTNNGGSVIVNTAAGAVLDETKLAKATSVVLGATASGSASAIDGIGTNGSHIDLNNQTLNVTSYTNQTLSGITSAGTLNVATATGAVLDSSKLATVDAITIAAGSATIDAATNDEAFLASRTTVSNGSTLTINNYTDADLSGMANQGSGTIVVNTTIGAVLDESKLSPVTTVVLGAAATGLAPAVDGIGSNGSRIDLNGQTLTLTGYTNQNLTGIIDSKPGVAKAWSRLQGTAFGDGATAGVVTGSDGSIFVGGTTEGNMGGQPLFGGQDPYVTKYTPDGAIVWTRQIGTASNEMSWSMAAGVDGSVYIASNNALNIDGQVNAGSWDAMLAKYNSDGTKAWTRLLGSSAAEMPGAIATAQDGSVYMSGTFVTSNPNATLDGQTYPGAWEDVFLTKYTSDGTKVWTRLFGSN
ncbi:MAG: beta strand repeat-containing protein, partial [Cyanobacteriota bacterium]